MESQQDRWERIKSEGIAVFEQEMVENEVPPNIREILHRECDKYYGCCPIQEQMMVLLMDVAGFSLKESNAARKTVAKKKMEEIPDLREKVLSKFENPTVGNYFWRLVVVPQLGYAFSENHSLPYSFVGIQSIELATRFDPIYWNTACLIVNSGAVDPDSGGQTDYGKIAKAMGDIVNRGIKISLADINHSDFGFKPDVANGQILYGLKGMLNVGDEFIKEIIEKRPYASPKDFLLRVHPKKQAMISLIKGGAFDNMMDRKLCMGWYIWETCDKKKRITLQNMNGLIKNKLLPQKTEEQIKAKRIYEFNRFLKSECKRTGSEFYYLDERAVNFMVEMKFESLLYVTGETYTLNIKEWDKEIYQKWMDVFRDWIARDKDEILFNLNSLIFKTDWEKYAKGNLSSWEMEALCFYYHEHELIHVNNDFYGFKDFFSMPEESEVEYSFMRGGKQINIFKLYKICGTCIAKNKTKSIVTLLTPTGVVNVKFRKEYFSLFDKQISERNPDGTKTIKEKSWFNKGNMIVVMGIRNGDDFISKKYAKENSHQLYKISEIHEDGTLTLQDCRYQGGELEEETDNEV